LNDHFDEDWRHHLPASPKMGLEGIVSKRLSAPYRSGPSPDSPAMIPGARERMVTCRDHQTPTPSEAL
jgi:hypothetical protein